MEIKKDIEVLGLKWCNYRKERGIYVIWSKDSVLSRILIALGAPIGKKPLQSTPLPKWILYAPKFIKKEFIAAYFGSDMTKPGVHVKNPRDIRVLCVVMYKHKRVKNGDLFLKQIKKCLKEFNVNSVVKLAGKKGNKLIYQLSIKNSRENLINFFKNIGYRYCKYKEELARKSLAYLLVRKMLIRNREEKLRIAKNLYKKGFKYSEIAKKIGISRHTIKNWLYYKKGEKEKHVSVNELPKFIDFNILIPESLVPD